MACNSCISTLSGFGESVVDTASGTVTTNGQTRALTETEKNITMGITKMFGAVIAGPVIGAVAGTVVGALAWSGKRWAGGILGFVGGGLLGGGIGVLLAEKAAKDHLEPAFQEISDAWLEGGAEGVIHVLPGSHPGYQLPDMNDMNWISPDAPEQVSIDQMISSAVDDLINQAKENNPVASAIIGSNNDKVIAMLPGDLVKPISRPELVNGQTRARTETERFGFTTTRPSRTARTAPSSTARRASIESTTSCTTVDGRHLKTAPSSTARTAPSSTAINFILPRTSFNEHPAPSPLPPRTIPLNTKISLRGIF